MFRLMTNIQQNRVAIVQTELLLPCMQLQLLNDDSLGI